MSTGEQLLTERRTLQCMAALPARYQHTRETNSCLHPASLMLARAVRKIRHVPAPSPHFLYGLGVSWSMGRFRIGVVACWEDSVTSLAGQ